MTTTTKIFGTDDFRRLADAVGLDAIMDEVTGRVQSGFESYDPAAVEVPVRSGFHYERPYPGLIEWMPVMARGRHALMKLVCYHPQNPATAGLPTILSTFALMDTGTGHLIAVSDGTFLTALRTGAASAIATRQLAGAGGGTVGVIGCGAQAMTQLHAIGRVYDIDLVLYWDVDPAARASAQARFSAILPAGVRMVESPIDLIVPNVDVLCTATSIGVGEGPLFGESRTREALHVNAVGSDFPGKVELPKSLLSASVVVPDFRDQAVVEGECQQLASSEVGPELNRIIQQGGGDDLRGRRTVFDSTGWALEDLVSMEALVDWGDDLGLGTDMQLESVPGDPKNPYRLSAAGNVAGRVGAPREGRS